MEAPHTFGHTGHTTETPITSAQYERILHRVSDPTRPRSAAGRLAAFLHDPAWARELVIQRCEDEAIAWVSKGRVLTEQRFRLICKCTSFERITAKALGISADLQRAGNAYERRLAMAGDPALLTRQDRERIWDEAVHEHYERQIRRNVRVIRYLPLHDGMSNNPGGGHMMRCGGLDAWERIFHQPHLRRIGVTGDDGQAVEDADKAIGVLDQPIFRPDATWLAQHGIDRSMLDALTDQELEAMGVDVASLRHAAGQAPTVAATPRHAVEHALYVVLRDAGLARRLAAANPERGAVRILHDLGMPWRKAATGVRFETMAEGVNDPTARLRLWDQACALGVKAHRDATRGRDGYREYLRCVAGILETMDTRAAVGA